MITKVILQNFKCFGEPATEIELKPLTIFVGPNGSGKSTVLEALGVLAQSALAPPSRHGLIWGKEIASIAALSPEQDLLVNLPSEESMFHRRENNRRLKVGVFARINIPALEEYLRKIGIEARTQVCDWGYLVECCGDTDEYVHELRSSEVLFARNTRRLIFRYEGGSEYKDCLEFPSRLPDNEFLPEASDRVLAKELFLPRETGSFQKGEPKYEEVRQWGTVSEMLVKLLSDELRRLYYLAGERSLRGRDESRRRESAARLGTFGEGTLPLLNNILGYTAHSKVAERIKRWASSFGLADLHAFDFRDPHYGTALDLHLAGHGSRQLLPVIIQLFWSESDSTIMIEEPEISLHPDAQAKLPEMFAEVVAEGKQLIITTHSEVLLLALRRALKKLSPDQIAVYHFNKSREGVSVKPLEVSEDGYIKGWVPSFAEIESELVKEWFDAVGQKIADAGNK